MKYYTYTHTRPDTNEIFYVGRGVGNRAWRKYGRNKHWGSIVTKNNGVFIVSIVNHFLTEDEVKKDEIRLINLYGRRDLNKGSLVNFTDGGEGTVGYIVKEETRLKRRLLLLGQKHTEEHKRKISDSMKGVIHSDECKKKLSIAHTGKIVSESTKQKLSLIFKDKHRLGLSTLPDNSGENSGKAKLKEFQVVEIKNLLSLGQLKAVEIASLYGVDARTISSIRHNKTWKHLN